jgi:hypothetical protein
LNQRWYAPPLDQTVDQTKATPVTTTVEVEQVTQRVTPQEEEELIESEDDDPSFSSSSQAGSYNEMSEDENENTSNGGSADPVIEEMAEVENGPASYQQTIIDEAI